MYVVVKLINKVAINLTQYLIVNRNSNLIEAVYPYYGLISLIGKTAYYQILPVKKLCLTSPEHLQYQVVKKKQNWQEKVLKHFQQKYQLREYYDFQLPAFYESIAKQNLAKSKNYYEKSQPQYRYHHYPHSKRHSTFSWRHIRNNNLTYQAKFNSYANLSKMRHPNRIVNNENSWDYEHWTNRETTGWKRRKIKHQYLVHLEK